MEYLFNMVKDEETKLARIREAAATGLDWSPGDLVAAYALGIIADRDATIEWYAEQEAGESV